MQKNLKIAYFIPFTILLFTLSISIFIYFISYEDLLAAAQNYTNKNLSTYLSRLTMLKIKECNIYIASINVILLIVTWKYRAKVNIWLHSLTLGAKAMFKSGKSTLQAFYKELSSNERLLLITIFIFGTIIRTQLSNQPLRGDEGLVYFQYSHLPIWMIVAAYDNVGNHILHTILMSFSVSLFGDNLLSIRLPALISGILLMPIAYCFFRLYRSKEVAIIASSFIAASSALLEYSANSRGYMLQIMLTFILINVGFYIAKNKNNFAYFIWAVFSALSFWTVPTMFYVYGGIWLWLASIICFKDGNLEKNKLILNLVIWTIIGGILTIILYLPVLLVNQGIGHMNTMLGSTVNGSEGLLRLFGFVKDLFELWTRNLYEPLKFISLISILFAIYISLVKEKLFYLKLEFWILFWAAFSASVVFHNFTRLWLVYSCFFYLFIAFGLNEIIKLLVKFSSNKLNSSRLQTTLICLISLVLLFSSLYNEIEYKHVFNNPADAFQDSKKAALFFKKKLTKNDLIYAPCPTAFPLKFEMQKLNITLFPVDKPVKDKPAMFFTLDREIGYKLKYRRVWIIVQSNFKDQILTSFPPLENAKLIISYPTGTLYEAYVNL